MISLRDRGHCFTLLFFLIVLFLLQIIFILEYTKERSDNKKIPICKKRAASNHACSKDETKTAYQIIAITELKNNKYVLKDITQPPKRSLLSELHIYLTESSLVRLEDTTELTQLNVWINMLFL